MISFDDDAPSTKKSKAKANGFLMFMLEYKRNEERRGITMDMGRAQVEAGELWKSKAKHDREKYENISTNSVEPKKYTSNGIAFEEMDRRNVEKMKEQKRMELTIETMLQTANESNKLKHLKFYFFSASYFVQTLKGDIFPAEIALSTFSLMDGVDSTLHFLVNPGPLPLGLASEAKTHSDESHRLKPPPNIEGEQSYETMFSDIMEFLVGSEGKRELPPIFVEPGMKDEDIKAAKLTLEKIVKEGGKGRNIEFRVYPMEQMLYRLNKKCVETRNAESSSHAKPFNSAIMAKDMMSRDEFMYADIGCQFHRNEDANNHCCLSKVKRWGYMISRLCLDRETDLMICGRHLPEKASALSEDDVQSSVCKDSDWASDLTNSLKTLRMDSNTTISHNSMSASTRSVSRMSESTASIHSFDEAQGVAPSTTDASESLQGFDVRGPYSVKSYSDLVRNSGRGGKLSSLQSGSGRGAKR